MLGRFHEISVQADDIVASIAFYEALGFRQLEVGETWQHPYAVLSDGRMHIGLHAYAFDSPALTFVRPELADYLTDFQARGVTLAFVKLDDDEFNEIGFTSPSRQMVTLLEARTYSPPPFDDRDFTLLGRFSQISLPVDDLESDNGFWVRLGMKPLDDDALSDGDIVLQCYEHAPFRQLVLTYTADDLAGRAQSLEARGIPVARDAPGFGRNSLLLRSPDDMALFIVEA